MEFNENHDVINKILNRSTNKKEENISDTYILASNKLREIYGDKTILFLQVGSFFEMYDKYKNKEKILKLIENGEDLFFRESENPDEKMTIADETYLPVYSNLIP